jgi:hypothetical protein
MLAAAVAIPVSGATMLLSTGQALAKSSGPKGKVTCTTLTGTITGTIVVSGCVNSNGATAGSASDPAPTSTLAAGGTITFNNGTTVTFAAAATSSTNAKHCPGYVKGSASEPSALKFSGQVSGSTAGLKIPGKYKGAVCISTAGNITALKALKTS